MEIQILNLHAKMKYVVLLVFSLFTFQCLHAAEEINYENVTGNAEEVTRASVSTGYYQNVSTVNAYAADPRANYQAAQPQAVYNAPVPEAADDTVSRRSNENANQQIAYFDELAGGKSESSFGGCSVRRKIKTAGCSTEFSLNQACGFSTVIDSLFQHLRKDTERYDMVKTGSYARNLVQPRVFNIVEKITFDRCDPAKKKMTFVTTSDEVTVDWLTLSSVRLEVELRYEDLSKPVNENWLKVRLDGTAVLDIAGESVNVDIKKNAGKGADDLGDDDVQISVPKFESMALTTFMTIINQPLQSLYPTPSAKNPTFDHQAMDLQNVVVEKGPDSLLEIFLTGEKMWNAYIRGATVNSPFFEGASKFYVYCKNGEADDFSTVVCSVMAKFNKGTFRWQDVTSIVPASGVLPGVEKGMLAEVLAATELYFQSSQLGIEMPDANDVVDEFEQYATILEGADKLPSSTFRQNYADAGACVRVKVGKIPKNYNIEGVSTYLVHACPYRDSVAIHLPFQPPTTEKSPGVFKYEDLPMLSRGFSSHNSFDIPLSQSVYNAEFEVKRNGDSQLTYCDSFNFYPKFDMLEGLPGAVTIVNTTFTECSPDGSSWKLTGNGKEQILNAVSHVSAITTGKRNNRHGVTGLLNIFDAEVILNRADSDYIPAGYSKTFKNIMSFPIKKDSFRFTKLFQKPRQLYLWGKCTLNEVEDIPFEIIEYMVPIKGEPKPVLGLCIMGSTMSVGEMIAYTYNSEVMNINSWKKYSEFNLLARKLTWGRAAFYLPSCKKLENNYKDQFPDGTPKQHIGLIITAKNNDFSNCEVDGNVVPLCQFYQRCFGDTLRVDYYGQLYPRTSKNNFQYFTMEGYSDQEMNLGPGVKLTAKEPYDADAIAAELNVDVRSVSEKRKRVKIIREATRRHKKNQEVNTDYLYWGRSGKIVHTTNMKVTYQTSESSESGEEKEILNLNDNIKGRIYLEKAQAYLPATIRFTGEKTTIKIEKIYDRNLYTDILDIPFVQVVRVKSGSNDLPIDKPIERIELNARLLIGSVPGSEVDIAGGPDNAHQYVYGRDKDGKNRNKMYSCISDKSRTKKLKLKSLFRAFGARLKQEIYKDAILRKACFTYHSGVDGEIWKIEEKQINAEAGLRLYGEIETANELGDPVEISFDNNIVHMVVTLPTMKWGVNIEQVMKKLPDGSTVQGEKEKVRALMILDEDEANTIGPKYSIRASNAGFMGGSIKGYLSTIGYQGDAQIDISNPSKKNFVYEFSHTGKLFSSIPGSMKLTATYTGADLSELDFDVNIDVFSEISKTIPKVIEDAVNNFIAPYKDSIDALDKAIADFSAKESEYTAYYNQLLRETDSAKTNVKRSKIERARTIQAAKKRCSHECKAVNMPGLKWENNCLAKSTGRVAGCMKFVKDKSLVSDVGCLSKCEAERVRSHIDSITQDAQTRSKIEEYAYTADCLDIANDLSLWFGADLLELEREKRDLESKGEFAELLHNSMTSNKNFLALTKLESKFKLIDLKEPGCAMLQAEVRVSGHDSQNFDYDGQFCFDGNSEKVAEDLIERVLNSGFSAELEEMKPVMDAANKKRVDLEAKYKKTHKPKEKNIELCKAKKQLPDKVTDEFGETKKRTSAFVPDTNLSPLRTSSFHVFRDKTILLFNKYSPWSTLERSNPFKDVTQNPVARSVTKPEPNENACASTKRSVQDYQDILQYMKKWALAHKDGETMLSNVKSVVEKRLLNTKNHIQNAGKGAGENDLVHMNHWLNVTESGMKRWLVESTKNLQHLNKVGMSLMKDQITRAYTDDQHKSIQSFFGSIAEQGDNAYKRANIDDGKNQKPFSNVADDLSNLLKETMQLDTALPILERIESKIGQVEKRSISCVS